MFVIFLGYLFIEREYEIYRLPDYYKELAKECKKTDGFGCCITSVNAMEAGGYKLVPKEGCQQGFQENMFKCIQSYKWCEPIE